MKFTDNYTKTIKEVLNGVAFIVLLHFLNIAYILIMNIYIKGQDIHMNIPSTPDWLYVFYAIIIKYILPSGIGLIIYLYIKKRYNKPLLCFIIALITLYPVFLNLLGIWEAATMPYFHKNLVTDDNLKTVTLRFIVLLYSLIPLKVISKFYNGSQTIWIIVLFVTSLYLYVFFFGNYYTLIIQ